MHQLDRASTSVSLNIAEGNGKFTSPDRCRFFDNARGSALESAGMPRRNGGQKIRRYGGNRNWQGNAGEDRVDAVWVSSRKLRHARFRRASKLSNRQRAGTRSGVRIRIRVAATD